MLVFFCHHSLCLFHVIFFPKFVFTFVFLIKSIFRCLMILDYPLKFKNLAKTKFCGVDGAGLLWNLL